MKPERFKAFTFDRGRGEPSFVQARKVERFYAAQLRKIARHIGELVASAPPGTVEEASLLADRLRRYAEVITPWARAVGHRMVADVARHDERAWRSRAAEMGRALAGEIASAPTGMTMRRLLDEQVGLIRSVPTEAAQRVHRLTLEGVTNGTRAKEIAAEIMRTGEVTKSRANLIARTEVGRTATALTQARAEHVGSDGYIWRTAHDSDVRPTHRAMEGKFVAWASPPELDGLTGHAGALPNCRCYPEPVLPKLR